MYREHSEQQWFNWDCKCSWQPTTRGIHYVVVGHCVGATWATSHTFKLCNGHASSSLRSAISGTFAPDTNPPPCGNHLRLVECRRCAHLWVSPQAETYIFEVIREFCGWLVPVEPPSTPVSSKTTPTNLCFAEPNLWRLFPVTKYEGKLYRFSTHPPSLWCLSCTPY